MSIWNTYSKDYPMPEGFEDPLNGGTDLCPSYFGFNDHMQIWFQDAETHKEIFGEEEFIHPFHIDVSYCQIEDCECVGRMIMDMHDYKRLDLKTWDEVLTEIDNYKTQLNTEKFNQQRYDNFRENFLASSNGIEMPEGFINSAWHNDVFPSIAHESGRVHIWFTDVDGWIGDFKQPPEDWKKYEFQGHPTKEVYAEEYALAGDPNYVKFETNDWNEILEKIEAWKKTQTELEQRIFRFHDGDNPLTTLKPMNALEILNLPDYVEDEQELLEFVKTAKVGDSIADISDYYDSVTRIE